MNKDPKHGCDCEFPRHMGDGTIFCCECGTQIAPDTMDTERPPVEITEREVPLPPQIP